MPFDNSIGKIIREINLHAQTLQSLAHIAGIIYDKTFGELPAEIKNQISHRARAVEELVKVLKKSFI